MGSGGVTVRRYEQIGRLRGWLADLLPQLKLPSDRALIEDDARIVKFIRARSGDTSDPEKNLQRAEAQIRKSAAWRLEYKPHEKLAWEPDPLFKQCVTITLT